MLIGGAALGGPAASAATGYISILATSAPSPATDVGLLTVSIASDEPITSLSVSIIPVDGDTPVLTLPMSDFTVPAQDGTGSYGAWTLTDPITTSQLALGAYSVLVSAASADATVSDFAEGTLTFQNEVSFPTFTSSGTTFSYDNQDVTFTGSATITAPGGTPAPFASEPLELLYDGNGPTAVTTAADGSFSVTLPASSEGYTMSYAGDADTAPGSSATITLTVVSFPVTMHAALKVAHAKYGQADDVTGSLTYADNGVSAPLADSDVSLYPAEGNGTPQATVTTNSAGDFTIAVPTTASQNWLVESPASMYLDAATVSLPLTVAQPNYVLGFRATLNSFAVVHVTGCVGATGGTVEVQYAAGRRGPWRNLGRWLPSGASCPHGSGFGSEYAGNYYARLTSAYYRVVYSASYQVQGVTSKSVHLARLLTKITSFRVSPRSGAYNSHFSVSGRLWAQNKDGKFTGYAHRKVILVYRYQGTYYRFVHEMTTNGAGDFSGRFPVYLSTPLFAQYNGDATHFASATKRINFKETGAAAIPAARGRAWPLAPPLARQLQAP